MILGAATTYDPAAPAISQPKTSLPIWTQQLLDRATAPTVAPPRGVPTLTATKPPRTETVGYNPRIVTTTAPVAPVPPTEPQGGVSINPTPPLPPTSGAPNTPTPINPVTGARIAASTTPTTGSLPAAAPAKTGIASLSKTEWVALAVLAALVIL